MNNTSKRFLIVLCECRFARNDEHMASYNTTAVRRISGRQMHQSSQQVVEMHQYV